MGLGEMATVGVWGRGDPSRLMLLNGQASQDVPFAPCSDSSVSRSPRPSDLLEIKNKPNQ